MPQIDLITPVYYNPDDAYHYLYDNLPLRNIIARQNLINMALDNVIAQMNDAIGTQNTVANRLNQSINPDGSLITASIDATMHTMDDHTDTANYVRMTSEQSTQLNALIGAMLGTGTVDLGLGVNVQTDDASPPTLVSFVNGVLEFDWSESVTISLTAPNKIKFNVNFDPSFVHRHYYDQIPVSKNLVTPDYINYWVNSTQEVTSFIDGSLRVYVNGIRVSQSTNVYAPVEIYAPGNLVTDPWTLLSFTPDGTNSGFAMSAALNSSDVIVVDYDIPLS